MGFETTEFIEAITNKVSQITSCYYEQAPTQDSVFPYVVLSGIHVSPLESAESGDLVSFYLDVWTDEKAGENATVQLEELCDTLRSRLQGETICSDGIFAGHICFENRGEIDDNEFDIAHRRITMTARIFYI